MKTAVILYPNQLFEICPLNLENKIVFLLEDPLFFKDKIYPANFHKQKLMLHRASMKFYESFLIDKGIEFVYVEYEQAKNKDFLKDIFEKYAIQAVEAIEPEDFILKKRLISHIQKAGISLNFFQNSGFLTPVDDLEKFERISKGKFSHAQFYRWQRKRLKILVDSDGNPVGGQWSYDENNRKKLPKGIEISKISKIPEKEFVIEAREYVEKNFPSNPGETELFNYPVTFEDSKKWLKTFLTERFKLFGPYEDAISKSESTLFHSVLSPLINTGLLTPDFVVDETINYAKKQNISIDSLEGFLRQIIGWREFMRYVYVKIGTKQRNSNFFTHKNKLIKRFYDGSTGIRPIDDAITSLNQTAYSHHIIRLMVIGNFFLLLEIEPTEVYKWFMEMYIDSYDWVMVPNVFGMSQCADGGKIVTKPYFSGSNYILKMSDYKGSEPALNQAGADLILKVSKTLNREVAWKDIWDGLFWRFVKKNATFLQRNARMGFLVNKVADKQESIAIADEYIREIFKN